MLNSDSLKRSAVGRIACDFGAKDLGAASVRPRNLPPTMRISDPAYGEDVARVALSRHPEVAGAAGPRRMTQHQPDRRPSRRAARAPQGDGSRFAPLAPFQPSA